MKEYTGWLITAQAAARQGTAAAPLEK